MFASNGAVTTNSSPLAFSFEPKPTQPHCGPHPPSEMENTRSSPRRNMKANELSGETRARQSLLGSSAERGVRKRPPSRAAAAIVNDHLSQRRNDGQIAQWILRFKSVIVSLLVDWFI